MPENSPFDIPARPRRRYTGDTVRYDGDVTFTLTPTRREHRNLEGTIQTILDAGPYRYGDWFDLPIPVWLVHDVDSQATFRVSVAETAIRLHVLPGTTDAGLEAFYRRLGDQTDDEWGIDRTVDL